MIGQSSQLQIRLQELESSNKNVDNYITNQKISISTSSIFIPKNGNEAFNQFCDNSILQTQLQVFLNEKKEIEEQIASLKKQIQK